MLPGSNSAAKVSGIQQQHRMPKQQPRLVRRESNATLHVPARSIVVFVIVRILRGEEVGRRRLESVALGFDPEERTLINTSHIDEFMQQRLRIKPTKSGHRWR